MIIDDNVVCFNIETLNVELYFALFLVVFVMWLCRNLTIYAVHVPLSYSHCIVIA